MKPGQSGDSLRYSFTLDGSAPADPVTSGQPWPGTRTWEAPEGLRTTLRVRVAAVSVAGLTTELPAAAVQFDRRPAPPRRRPSNRLPTATRRTRFPAPASSATRSRPTGARPRFREPSRLVGDGLSLAGTAGQTVLYRFRWRAYSAAGEPGPVSDPYSVLVDRTLSLAFGRPRGFDTVPLLAGIPRIGSQRRALSPRILSGREARATSLQEGLGDPSGGHRRFAALERHADLGADGVDRTYTGTRGFLARRASRRRQRVALGRPRGSTPGRRLRPRHSEKTRGLCWTRPQRRRDL